MIERYWKWRRRKLGLDRLDLIEGQLTTLLIRQQKVQITLYEVASLLGLGTGEQEEAVTKEQIDGSDPHGL